METDALLSLNLNYWVMQTLAMVATAILLPKFRIRSIFGPILAVVALAFINSKVWDAALFFQIPNQFSTKALLLLVSNGAIFWLLVKFLPGIEIDSFLVALIAPIIFTVFSLLINEYLQDVNWQQVLQSALEFMQYLKGYFLNETPAPESPEETALLLEFSYAAIR